MSCEDVTRRMMTAGGIGAALGALALAAAPAAAAESPASDPQIVGTGNDGEPVRRALRMGEAYLTSCIIRLDGNPGSATGWASRHENNSHRSYNVSGRPTVEPIHMVRNGHQVGGALWVPFREHRPVAFAFAGSDEAFPALGVDVGVSGGATGANIVFWHRAQGRYLDVTKAADRALAGTNSCNIWFAVISGGAM